ncbi:MAG: tRNA (N(6)-L-threonylcarbamoyladenosine(37)-C(2))-methylthiotransferase MtaB [Clostridia bacterium]|nr:tRNA (N(6)-L-threonylcarbamoyladenosine(37)-C(2))-methylthiotransferase MtaB [Clostridia bacterium]
MKTVAFSTLGCKVNQYDTDLMKSAFSDRGYSIVEPGGKADIHIINTCTVTSTAAKKSRQAAGRARKANPRSIVVLTGCLGQLEGADVLAITGADIVTGNAGKNIIVDIVERFDGRPVSAVGDIFECRDYDQKGVSLQDSRTRVYIKVQDGCNNYCSYCAIPYARGRSRSRNPVDVMEEIRSHAENGAREVVITGIHLDSYGKDLEGVSLVGLLEEIDRIDGIERIRLGSLEPLFINLEFVKRASCIRKLCPHFHLSLQSGCDETLARMRRRYTKGMYRQAVDILKKHIPGCSFTTDVIVGFPGETDEEFAMTEEFVSEIDFLKVHVFRFSPRKGTAAFTMKGRVPQGIINDRAARISKAASISRKRFLDDYIGRTVYVLAEQPSHDIPGAWEGHSPEYIRIAFMADDISPNDSVLVKINGIRDEFVLGSLHVYI